MNETEFQQRVMTLISQGNTDKVVAGVTDNERAVILRSGDLDAAYTADEARELAGEVERLATAEDWSDPPDDFCAYVRDLADLVDNVMTESEVREQWSDRIDDEE